MAQEIRVWRDLEERHKAAVARKYERIATLKALLKEWEGHEDKDMDYIRDIKKRLRGEETQLKVMKP